MDVQAPGPRPVNAPPADAPIHQVEQIVGTAFSADNAHALIHFKDAKGESVLLTMAVEKLATLQHLAAQMRQRLNRKDLPVDNIVMQFPQQFSVGHSDQHRGVCAITFDPKMPSEAVYVLTDEAALGLADGLQQNVLSRMTPAERAEHLKRKHPLLLPTQPKIIRPGQ